MSLTVSIDHSADPQQLARTIASSAGPVTEAESKVIAAAVARLVQRHLRQRDTTHAHKYPAGGRRSRFWRKAAQSVTFAADADGLSVSVTHQGARLRYAGAPDGIRPVTAKALAIPASGEAYGRLPGEFPDLRLVVFKSANRAALVQRAKAKGAPDKVMFWLVRKTKPVAPDLSVLPSPETVLDTASAQLKTLRNRKAAANVQL